MNMKTTISILVLVLAVFSVKAGDLPTANAFFTTDNTILLNGVGETNVLRGTNYIGNSLYHTWYLNSTNLNGNTCAIAFSGDNSNYVAWGTIAIATGATVATNYTGKQNWVRYTFAGTNALGTLIYLGGR